MVIGTRQGLSDGEVSALVAAFGACLLLGSFLSPLVRRLLPVRAVLVLELWTWLGCAAFLVRPNVYVLTAGLLPTALAIPSASALLGAVSARATIAVFAGFALVLAVWGTLSPSIRAAPSLDELAV